MDGAERKVNLGGNESYLWRPLTTESNQARLNLIYAYAVKVVFGIESELFRNSLTWGEWGVYLRYEGMCLSFTQGGHYPLGVYIQCGFGALHVFGVCWG